MLYLLLILILSTFLFIVRSVWPLATLTPFVKQQPWSDTRVRLLWNNSSCLRWCVVIASHSVSFFFFLSSRQPCFCSYMLDVWPHFLALSKMLDHLCRKIIPLLSASRHPIPPSFTFAAFCSFSPWTNVSIVQMVGYFPIYVYLLPYSLCKIWCQEIRRWTVFQVEHLSQLERAIPTFILSKVQVTEYVEYPNRHKKLKAKASVLLCLCHRFELAARAW